MKHDGFHSSSRKILMYVKYWHTNKNYLLINFTKKKKYPPLSQLSRHSLDINQHKAFAKWMASIKQRQLSLLILASPPITFISNITVLLYLQDETMNQIPFCLQAVREQRNSIQGSQLPKQVLNSRRPQERSRAPTLLSVPDAPDKTPRDGLFRRTEISGNFYSFHEADPILLWTRNGLSVRRTDL